MIEVGFLELFLVLGLILAGLVFSYLKVDSIAGVCLISATVLMALRVSGSA